MNLLNTLHDFCTHHGRDTTCWVAYSGGLDSHVLLSACVKLRSMHPLKLRAIHVNHGLSPSAASWADHCTAICQAYGVNLVLPRIQVCRSAGESLEEVARELRYAAFAQYLADGDVLLTAHQQDDQAETVLLQLLRGAGPKGLAAMSPVKSLGRGLHGRPLLAFPRSFLQQYAGENQLSFIEDESNANLKLTRNFIRHEVLPLLKRRWPTATQILSRVAEHCAETHALLEQETEQDLTELQGEGSHTLSIKKLLQYSPAKQRFLLRQWIYRLNYPVPDTKKMQTIQRNVLTARSDAAPCVQWQNVELRRYRDELYILQQLPLQDVEQRITWDLTQPLFFPGIGKLQAFLGPDYGLDASIKQVSVRFRQGGETLFLAGRGHRALKNLFQEWGVPPWERNRMPLVYVDDMLVAIPQFFLHENYAAKKGGVGYEIRFSLPSRF